MYCDCHINSTVSSAPPPPPKKKETKKTLKTNVRDATFQEISGRKKELLTGKMKQCLSKGGGGGGGEKKRKMYKSSLLNEKPKIQNGSLLHVPVFSQLI